MIPKRVTKDRFYQLSVNEPRKFPFLIQEVWLRPRFYLMNLSQCGDDSSSSLRAGSEHQNYTHDYSNIHLRIINWVWIKNLHLPIEGNKVCLGICRKFLLSRLGVAIRFSISQENNLIP